MKKSRFTESQMLAILKQGESGGMSQVSVPDRSLRYWEGFSGFINFFNSEEHGQQIVLLAD
ncbi:MAG: hypothetical protein RIF37_14850, partial [Rhodospirillaceae bacterium]